MTVKCGSNTFHKIVSVFEDSTEVIRKGKASEPTEFGKIVQIQEAENQIVIDFEVYDQKPSDGDLLIPSIEAHQERMGRTPDLAAADAGFYSAVVFRKTEFCAEK
jgi:IS5 family transposase